MVILQFNKLIRNKWFWGAFALVISAAFCFEGLFDSRGTPEKRDADAGTLSGRPVDAALFRACVADVREAQSRSGDRFAETEVNKNAAKLYAALETAGRAGVSISDAMLADRIVAGFGGPANFDSAGYAAYVAQAFGLSPDAFEQRMRRRMTVQDGLLRAMLSSAVWVSPAELERAVEDATDTFTVKIVSFRQDKKDADAVKVDEAALKKWYDENTSKIELPELVKLRMVRYQTSNTNVLAKMEVSDNDMHDWYDSNIERFTSTDTNGVETVRKFEEVKDEVEREVRKIAAANYYETNLLRRAYMKVAEQEKGKSRLDAIAREDGVAVVESGWFSPTGRYVEGFTVRRESVAPGARNFAEVVAELDPESEDLRYGVVTSPSSVWLVEKSAVQAPKTPTFEEAKGGAGRGGNRQGGEGSSRGEKHFHQYRVCRQRDASKRVSQCPRGCRRGDETVQGRDFGVCFDRPRTCNRGVLRRPHGR